MLVSELLLKVLAAVSGDQVRVQAAPADSQFNTILALATVADTMNSGGTFWVVLNPINMTFRIRAPQNSALNELLSRSNVLLVDVTTEGGVASFQIDT